MKLACLLFLAFLAAGCGYGSKYNPATGGMATAAMNITTLTPDNATAGGPAFMLTVNGSNFAANSVIFFDGTAETTTFVTGSQLMAAIPAAAIATSGAKSVYVNSAGNIYGVNSNTVNFTVN